MIGERTVVGLEIHGGRLEVGEIPPLGEGFRDLASQQ